MRAGTTHLLSALLLFAACLASACSPQPQPVASPTASQVLAATATARPSATATPTPSPSPTPTLTSTPTPTATASPTPSGGANVLLFALPRSQFEALFPELEGQVHIFRQAAGGELAPVTEGLNTFNRLVDISPDGAEMLVISSGGEESQYGELYLISADGSHRRPLPHKARVSRNRLGDTAAFAIRGERIAYVANDGSSLDGVFLVDRSALGADLELNEGLRLSPPNTNVVRIIDTPGSREYVFWEQGSRSGNSTTISGVWWGTVDGSQANRFSKNIEAISPDGLSFIEELRQRLLMSRMGSDEQVELELPADLPVLNLDRFFWSPDGGRILLGAYDYSQKIYFYPYTWSVPDGDLVGVPAQETIGFDLGGHSWPPQASWSPDGNRIAVSNGCQILLIDLRLESVRKAVIPCENYSNYPVWSPDSRQILLFGGAVPQLLDAETLQLQRVEGLGDIAAQPVRWLLPYGGGWASP